MNPYGFHTALVNDFILEHKYAAQLESYYLLHWELQYFIAQTTIENRISHNGVTYIPVFQSGLIASMNPKQQCKLSFRETNKNSHIPNYVLIKAA